MKTILNAILFVLFISSSKAQTLNQIDSINKKRVDSLYNIKINYINFPLSKLLTDINLPVDFSMPDALGRKKYGTSFYKNFIVYLPNFDSIPLRGFKIEINNKYIVSVPEYYRLRGQAWENKMKIELGTQIVTSIKKL